jgi:hypothetical protein
VLTSAHRLQMDKMAIRKRLHLSSLQSYQLTLTMSKEEFRIFITGTPYSDGIYLQLRCVFITVSRGSSTDVIGDFLMLRQ